MTRLNTLKPLAPFGPAPWLAAAKNAALPALQTQAPSSLPGLAQEAQSSFGTRPQWTPTTQKPNNRKQARLDPEDPATYEKLKQNVSDVAETSSHWSEFFQGLGRVLDVIDIPRMAINKMINLVVQAKANSPDESIIGGERIYGADFMREFGIENRALQMVGGFLWDVVTDPISWISPAAIGGILKGATKVSAGKAAGQGVERVLSASVAKKAAASLDKVGAAGMFDELVRAGNLKLQNLGKLDEVARVAGMADELALARTTAQGLKTGGQASGLAIGQGVRNIEDVGRAAINKLGIGHEAVGQLFKEVVDSGKLARRGFSFGTESLKKFPLWPTNWTQRGRKVMDALPGFQTRELLKPGALSFAAAPRVASALYGGIAGAATGNVLGDSPGAAAAGAVTGAIAGAIAGPRILGAAGKALAPLKSQLVRAFSHNPEGSLRILGDWGELAKRAQGDDVARLGETIPKQFNALRDSLGKTLKLSISDEQAFYITEAMAATEARSPQRMFDIVGDILGKSSDDIAELATGPLGQFQILAPEIIEGGATHAILPAGNRFQLLKATTDADGAKSFVRREIFGSVEDAEKFVKGVGGKPAVMLGESRIPGSYTTAKGADLLDTVSADDLDMNILQYDSGVQLDPEYTKLIDSMAARRAAQLEGVEGLGLPQTELTAPDTSYVHHLMMAEDSNTLWQSLKKAAFSGKKESHELARVDDFRNKTLWEIKRMKETAAASKGANLGKNVPVGQLHEADPLLYETRRQAAHNRIMGSGNALAEIRDKLGQPLAGMDDATREGLEAAGWGEFQSNRNSSKTIGLLEGHIFPPEELARIHNVDQVLSKPGPWLNAFDKVMNTVKGWLLIAPAFHFRNFGSNIWLSMAEDGFTVRGWTEGMKTMKAMRSQNPQHLGRVIKGVKNLAGQDMTTGQLIDELGPQLLKRTFAEAEFTPRIAEVMSGTSAKRMSTLKKVLDPREWAQLNRGVGSFIEDGSKVGHVITRMRAGDNIEQAVASAQRVMFDYTKLTPFERNVARRVFPFYSWARNNAALQIDLLMQRPELAAAMPKLKGNIEASLPMGDVLPNALRPDYIRREAGIQFTGGLRPTFMNAPTFFPLNELKMLDIRNGVPSGAIQQALDMANPVVKKTIELAINRDFFFDKPIRNFPGETVRFLGAQIPPELRSVISMARPLNEANRVVYGIQRGEGAGTIAGRLTGARLFEGNLPREIAGFQRRQAATRGYMRAKAKRALANGDQGMFETVLETMEAHGMKEEGIKMRILAAQAAGDYKIVKELVAQLAQVRQERLGTGATSTQIKALRQTLSQ